MKTIVLLVTMLLTGCQCFGPNASTSTGCKVVNAIVDCTKGAVSSEIPQLAPLVSWILQGAPGGQMDWSTLLSSLEGAGFNLIGCTAANIEQVLVTKASVYSKEASPEAVQVSMTVHNNFKQYMSKFHPNVRFKLPTTPDPRLLKVLGVSYGPKVH